MLFLKNVTNTNTLVVEPRYPKPIMSMPPFANLLNLAALDQVSELGNFVPPYIYLACGPTAPPLGTSHPLSPIPSHIFYCLQQCQKKQK